MEETRSGYAKFLWGNIFGRQRRRLKDNVKMNLRHFGCETEMGGTGSGSYSEAGYAISFTEPSISADSFNRLLCVRVNCTVRHVTITLKSR
jgi:hypothetical protein